MRKREFIATSPASLADVERQRVGMTFRRGGFSGHRIGGMRRRWNFGQRANEERTGRDSTEHGYTADKQSANAT
jgi:hypothetical protein